LFVDSHQVADFASPRSAPLAGHQLHQINALPPICLKKQLYAAWRKLNLCGPAAF